MTERADPLPTTHVCQKCGRGFIWEDPQKPLPTQVDEYGVYVLTNGIRTKVVCGGAIVPIVTEERDAAD